MGLLDYLGQNVGAKESSSEAITKWNSTGASKLFAAMTERTTHTKNCMRLSDSSRELLVHLQMTLREPVELRVGCEPSNRSITRASTCGWSRLTIFCVMRTNVNTPETQDTAFTDHLIFLLDWIDIRACLLMPLVLIVTVHVKDVSDDHSSVKNLLFSSGFWSPRWNRPNKAFAWSAFPEIHQCRTWVMTDW